MATRKTNNNTPGLADLEGTTSPAEVPGFMPPPGVEAVFENKVRYNQVIVKPEDYYGDDLRELAAAEDDRPTPAPLTDPLTDFCDNWRNFAGYPLRVVRLPDPANKRMPGQAYNNTCLEITSLGSLPFDPDNIVPTLQLINGNSGGAFRLFLSDEGGQIIPNARLDRILIPDPPKAYNPRSSYESTVASDYALERHYGVRNREPQPAPQPPPKSASEQRLEQLKDSLFEKLLIRALDPPAPPTVDPLSTIPEGDRLALSLLRQGDLLPTLVERISSLAQAPDRIESATWKDKLADAGLQLVTNNPQIVATATDILSRTAIAITTALSSAFAPRPQQPQIVNEPLPIQHPPAQRIPAPQAIAGLPETPQPEDEGTDNEEDAEIDLMEEIVKLLLGDKPLRLDDPVILDIRADYPAIFDAAMLGIAKWPADTIIQYLCAKSDFCADMFQGGITGPHLRHRLEELKVLLNANVQATENATTAENYDANPVPAV